MELGLSLSPNCVGVMGGGGGPSLLPETQAWLDALTTAGLAHPTTEHIAAIDTCIGSLISAGVWAKLDLLPLFFLQSAEGADSEGLALMDLKALQQWTAVNGPTFTAGVGFAGDGVSATVNWTHEFYTGLVGFSQASASFGAFVNDGFGSSSVVGGGINTNVCSLRVNNGVNRLTCNAGGAANPTANTSALLSLDRSAPESLTSYTNGSVVSVDSNNNNVGVSNVNPMFLRSGGAYTPIGASVLAGAVGASLGDAGQLALYNAIQTLRSAVA